MGHDEVQVDEDSEQMEDLERKVRTWKWWVAGFAVCLVATYLIYFGVHLGQSAATEASTWGTFGDFVGGLMNPVVAFAAFFWLTESVKIQKTELAETRRELAEATQAQVALVANGRVSVRLAALTALVNTESNAINNLDNSINSLKAGQTDTPASSREYIHQEALKSKIANLERDRRERERVRQPYMDEMMEILQSQR